MVCYVGNDISRDASASILGRLGSLCLSVDGMIFCIFRVYESWIFFAVSCVEHCVSFSAYGNHANVCSGSSLILCT